MICGYCYDDKILKEVPILRSIGNGKFKQTGTCTNLCEDCIKITTRVILLCECCDDFYNIKGGNNE